MPDEREIYRDPVTGTYLDPLAVQRKLLVGSRGQVNAWIAEQRGEDEVAAMVAEEKLVPLIRQAFGLREINPTTGDGHPTSMCLKCLECFLTWADAKKVKGQTSLSSSPCADCP